MPASQGRSSLPDYPYASARWANAVARIVDHARDTRTIGEWGRLVGASRATLGNWCRAARTSPRGSLELGRLLRALRETEGELGLLQDALDVIEPRTLTRLLSRAGIDDNRSPSRQCGPRDFLAVQRLVANARAVQMLAHVLEDRALLR